MIMISKTFEGSNKNWSLVIKMGVVDNRRPSHWQEIHSFQQMPGYLATFITREQKEYGMHDEFVFYLSVPATLLLDFKQWKAFLKTCKLCSQ